MPNALNDGLNAGLSISELKEILVQLYAYAGFPRSLNALQCLMDVLKERKPKGITDVPGNVPSPLPTDKTKRELGTEIQTHLLGRPVTGELYDFAPAICRFGDPIEIHTFLFVFHNFRNNKVNSFVGRQIGLPYLQQALT